MKRTECGGCRSRGLVMFLDLGETPAANVLPRDASSIETFYPLQLGVCTDCWLVQQLELVPDEQLYDYDYAFYSGASYPKVRYHMDLADRIMRAHHQLAERFIVEIACNDGDLLRHLNAVGGRALGIDPAGGPVEMARDRGLDVVHAPFGKDVASDVRANRGPASIIIANHVIAHVSDLDDVFTGLAHLLAPDGVIIIEVQYLVDLLVGNQLDHVYHEHRFHFSLTSLENVARRYGFYVNDVRRTPAQSGSISVTLSHEPRTTVELDRMRLSERWLLSEVAYHGVQGRAEYVRHLLLELLASERAAGRRVAGYGAPAKATTLLNYCDIGIGTLEYVIDTTAHKQGRLIPGVHVPIIAPNAYEKPDTYLLLVHNYLADVLERERDFKQDGGRFIVPIPVPVLL